MGRFTSQLIDGRVNKIEITYSGDLANQEVAPITTALLKGFLDTVYRKWLTMSMHRF